MGTGQPQQVAVFPETPQAIIETYDSGNNAEAVCSYMELALRSSI